jgi:hypothetical protein
LRKRSSPGTAPTSWLLRTICSTVVVIDDAAALVLAADTIVAKAIRCRIAGAEGGQSRVGGRDSLSRTGTVPRRL